MAAKIPGMFRKPIKEKRLQKRFLKFIEQPTDREFLLSCFDLNDGIYTIKAEFLDLENKATQAAVKRLKTLAKAIRKNRQRTVKILPLTICVLIVAALTAFFVIIMDPLLEGLLEQGMEEIFEAKTDVEGFHLGLIRFRIGIHSITVANRDEPMKNLFETGRLEIRLKPQAVLRGKIYIEEIRADGLRFGTARKTSGALPRYAARIAARNARPPDPPLVDLAKFDAMALLNQEYDKLQSPKAYDAAIASYNEARDRWKAQYNSAAAKVKELQAAAQPVININVNNIKTPEEAAKVVGDITALYNSVESTRGEVETIAGGVQNDISTARNLERSARESIQADIDHLKSYLDLGSGNALKALEPTLRAMLSDKALEYLSYGQRGLEAMEKLKALQAKIPKSEPKEKKSVFKGRDVIFPTPTYPRFYLDLMASDFTLGEWNWAFAIKAISSDPDISNRPTELALTLNEQTAPRRKAGVHASADFRSNAQQYFGVDVNGANFPVDIQKDLRSVGIGGFSGSAGFTANLSGGRGGAVAGGGGLDIREPRLRDPRGTVAESVQEAMEVINDLTLGVQYQHPVSGSDTFTLTTNIGDLIMESLRRAAQRYLRQAEAAIEKALRDRIESYLDGKWVSKEQLDDIFAAVKGDQSAVNRLKSAMEDKKNEIEKKFRSAAEEAVDRAKEGAKEKLEDSLQNLLPGSSSGSSGGGRTPSLPGGIKRPF